MRDEATTLERSAQGQNLMRWIFGPLHTSIPLSACESITEDAGPTCDANPDSATVAYFWERLMVLWPNLSMLHLSNVLRATEPWWLVLASHLPAGGTVEIEIKTLRIRHRSAGSIGTGPAANNASGSSMGPRWARKGS